VWVQMGIIEFIDTKKLYDSMASRRPWYHSEFNGMSGKLEQGLLLY
jgi:hypothetical protein